MSAKEAVPSCLTSRGTRHDSPTAASRRPPRSGAPPCGTASCSLSARLLAKPCTNEVV